MNIVGDLKEIERALDYLVALREDEYLTHEEFCEIKKRIDNKILKFLVEEEQ